MNSGLKFIFNKLIKSGSLIFILADGSRCNFGDGIGVPVIVRFADRKAQWELLLDPELKLGELFMDGRLVVEQGTIFDFLTLILRDMRGERPPFFVKILERARHALRYVLQNNTTTNAKRNVAHHYDLDDRLYQLFLDEDRQYSCAYFENEYDSLEVAQLAKKRHITAKLLVEPGMSVLDIGCGWGGMALYLAQMAGAGFVRGITLSEEQHRNANARVARAHLGDRITIALEDYRQTQGTFDRIVSVGMFEHVGAPFYRNFFKMCADRLKEDGVMLLHTIGNCDEPAPTNPFIAKYIFPGGYIPSLSEICREVELLGLMITDVEVKRLHYAYTLREWRKRFLARRDEALKIYDERFCKMWEFYLSASEASFRYEGIVVFQIQLAKMQESVPLTRDYIAKREELLRQAEQQAAQLQLVTSAQTN
eukprot:gene12101-biopygen7336